MKLINIDMRVTLSIFAAILLMGCGDALVKTLDFEEFDFERQMAVSGTLNSSEPILDILIAQNQAITEPQLEDINYVSNAEISLFRESEKLDAEVFYDKVYSLDLSNVELIPGNYTLEVNHPDFPLAKATTQIPPNVPLKSIEYIVDAGIAPGSMQKSDGIKIVFDDPIGKNFYNLNISYKEIVFDTFIYAQDTFIYQSNVHLELDSNLPSANVSNNGVLFTDGFFEGTEHSMILFVKSYETDELETQLDELLLRWDVISEDQYNFEVSRESYNNSQDFGPFSEAVTLYNNIDGGLGIFAGLNRTYLDIE